MFILLNGCLSVIPGASEQSVRDPEEAPQTELRPGRETDLPPGEGRAQRG